MYRGILLGETPSNIRKKEQDIIDFAGLGDFINYLLNHDTLSKFEFPLICN